MRKTSSRSTRGIAHTDPHHQPRLPRRERLHVHAYYDQASIHGHRLFYSICCHLHLERLRRRRPERARLHLLRRDLDHHQRGGMRRMCVGDSALGLRSGKSLPKSPFRARCE